MCHNLLLKPKKNYYERQASLAEFLTWYHQQELPEYEKPSLTVDMVLLCYNKEADQLKVLLIQRKGHPLETHGRFLAVLLIATNLLKIVF